MPNSTFPSRTPMAKFVTGAVLRVDGGASMGF